LPIKSKFFLLLFTTHFYYILKVHDIPLLNILIAQSNLEIRYERAEFKNRTRCSHSKSR